MDKGELRQGTSRFGKKWKRNHLSIKDKTASIKLVLWDENSKIVDDINVGDRILLKNGYAREYIRGNDRELQISLRKDGAVDVINAEEDVGDLEGDQEEIEKVIEEGYDVYEEYKEDSWRG